MPVLNVSTALIRDADAFSDYVAKAADLMKLHGVTTVVRGKARSNAGAASRPTRVVAVFRYPNLAAAEAFFTSSDYLALVPLRERACDMTIAFFEEIG